MKAKDSGKATRRKVPQGRRGVLDDSRKIELVQNLMAMQIQMSELSERLPRKSMFDGIPKGASPYYFYSLSAKAE